MRRRWCLAPRGSRLKVDYGGPTDTWGTTWTPSDINGPGFGAALRTRYDFISGNNDAGVDSMRITVRYCD